MHAGCLTWHQNSQGAPCCREAAPPTSTMAWEASGGTASRHSLSSCSSESMFVPVLGALLALSKSQFLYHSLGRGSFSVTAYSVPCVSQRSARVETVFRGHQPSQFGLPVLDSGSVPFHIFLSRKCSI